MISKVEDIFKQGTEGYTELTNLVLNIPLVNWMINPNRPRSKDMPRDSKGRIIVDVSRPHILENMSYFIKTRETFLTTGKYCPYYPSRSPNSPYKKFWDEEIRRCLEGYVREEDGEWIPGYYYYYLNYGPILLTKRVEGEASRVDRVEGFPDIWDGDYMFFHYVDQAEKAGKHGATLKARGKGYSFKLASMLNRNFFLISKSKSYAFAAESEYLDADGILNKADDNFSFVNTHCGFSKKLALKDSLMHRISGYTKPGDSTKYGFKSERIGVTLKNNPQKSRGKRGKLIAWEESGSNPNLIQSWNIALKSLEDGKRVFGFQIAFGTGGDEASNFQGLEQLFYKCKAYHVYGIRNVFDKNSEKNTCALFIPDYLNRADCYDRDGNSDVIKALGEDIEHRLEVKYSSDDTQYLSRVKAEEPITPQEAFMRIQGSEFPVHELKEHLANISPAREQFLSNHYIVDLTWIGSDKVEYKPVFDKHPIREWPYKGTNLLGAIEIFELPQATKGKEIPNGRYIAGIDPVDDDTYKTYGISLFGVHVFDLWNDVFVAEWIGRHPLADDNFDIALKLAVFYNAQINYENNRKGLYEYINRRNKLRYLAETPSILKDMNYIKDARLIGNRSYGTPASVQINAWARKQQADWMRSENKQRPIIITNSEGEEKVEYNLNVKSIRSFGYLQECISWNLDGNFDRVSAANMVFVLRADRYKQVEATRNTDNDDEDEYANDAFLTNNYHRRQSQNPMLANSNLQFDF
jgi:hypothetical protein